MTRKTKMIEELRSIVEDFFQHAIKSLKKMKTKHKKELLEYARFAPAKSAEKRTSTLTNSSFMHSKNNLNDDDISVIDLEDLRLSSAKC